MTTVCADESLDLSQIPQLIEKLTDDEPSIRGRAADALSQFGPQAKAAIFDLVELLADEAPVKPDAPIKIAVGDAASFALVSLGPEAISALMAATTSENRGIRKRAIDALGQIGVKARSAAKSVIPFMMDSDRNVRTLAINVLSRIDPQGDESISALLEGLKDQDITVRSTAAMALGKLHSHHEESVPQLVRALNDKAPIVRGSAARALGQLAKSPKRVVHALIERLKNDQEGYPSSFDGGHFGNVVCVADEAVWALGQFGSDAQSATPYLIEVLTRQTSPTQLEKIAKTIVRLGQPAEPFILKLNENLLQSNTMLETQIAILQIFRDLGPTAKLAIPAINEMIAMATRKSQALQVADAISADTFSFLEGLFFESYDDRDTLSEIILAGESALICIDFERNQTAWEHILTELGRRIDNPNADWELSNSSLDVVLAAIRNLGLKAKSAAPILNDLLLRDSNCSEQVLKRIAITIGKIDEGFPETNEPTDFLVKSLNWTFESDNSVKSALKGYGKTAIWSLTNGLADCEENHSQRIRILETLGEFGEQADPIILIVLRIAERDEERDVRVAAIKTVGKIHTSPEVVVPTLIQLLNDERPAIREQAALSLAAYGSSASVAAVTLTRLLDDDYIDVREAVEMAIKSLK